VVSVVRTTLGFGCVLVVPFFIAGILGVSVNLFPRILRAGLKASSIVWSPLIFYLDAPLMVIRSGRKELVPHYKGSAITRLAVRYSYLVILIAAGLTIAAFAKFLAREWLDGPTVTLIHVWSCLGVINAIITILLWDVVIPRIEYNVGAGIDDQWWRVLVPAKLVQGIIAMLMIPTTLLSLWPWLPHISAFVLSLRPAI
jgi:hypothetical protein